MRFLAMCMDPNLKKIIGALFIAALVLNVGFVSFRIYSFSDFWLVIIIVAFLSWVLGYFKKD